MSEIVKSINKIIGWYGRLSSDSADLDGVMYKRKQLVTYYYSLASEMGEARKNAKRKVGRYEIEKVEKQIDFLGSQKALTKAELYAKANTAKLKQEADDAEAEFEKLRYLFHAVKEVLSAMNQRIAQMREEWRKANFYEK